MTIQYVDALTKKVLKEKDVATFDKPCCGSIIPLVIPSGFHFGQQSFNHLNFSVTEVLATDGVTTVSGLVAA